MKEEFQVKLINETMDVEKYASGKLYLFFEWAFKLIVWNLLTLLIVAIFACAPAITFYKIQNDHLINSVDNDDNGKVIVTLNNGQQTVVGVNITSHIKELKIDLIRVKDDYIYLDLYYDEDLYTVAIPNKEKYREIDKDKTYFNESNELILYGMKKETNIGNIFDSTFSNEQSKIDINKNVVISLENGTKINYGNKIDTKSTLCGVLIIIALILGLFAFIPCFITIFSMIKIFSENGSTSTFTLFFDRLWDNFKAIYKVELVIIPLLLVMSFALYFYYRIINGLQSKTFFLTFSYSIILITLIIFVLWIVNLPMTLAYFRMRPFVIVKFTLIMTFKNILFTFLYVIIYIIPIMICFINGFFIPVWFLVGISLPELIIYLLSAKKYRYLVQNIDIITEDDLED